MRARIAKQLIAGIGISAITLCGTAVIARADPPPDKKQHDKHAPAKPAQAQPAQAKPAHAQAKPPQPQGHQEQARAPQQHPAPQAQQPAQRPAEQAHHQPQQQPAAPHAQPQEARREATPHPKPAQQVRKEKEEARQQPQQIHGGAQKQEVRAVPRPIPAPPERVSAPVSAPVNSTVRRVRLAPQQQHVLIAQQQQRISRYSADLNQGRRVVEQQSVELQRQHRNAQYRYMQSYVSGLQQQEVALRDYRYYDYDNDPYFYTPADYRYYRGDQYYETNQYGIALLRQALNNGYREGRLAGMADREDGWRPSYGSSYAYRDANYGYNGYYLDRGTYNYYFREGFRRGYDDGYNSSYRYGRYSNGTGSLLDTILNAVLRVQRLG